MNLLRRIDARIRSHAEEGKPPTLLARLATIAALVVGLVIARLVPASPLRTALLVAVIALCLVWAFGEWSAHRLLKDRHDR